MPTMEEARDARYPLAGLDRNSLGYAECQREGYAAGWSDLAKLVREYFETDLYTPEREAAESALREATKE